MTSSDTPWDPASALSAADRTHFSNHWNDLCDLNVPGPFYTGETDNCRTGRLHAPDNVMYGGEHFTEYIFRQPRAAAEVAAVVVAAEEDPFAGYGCDGDAHWTADAVRAWWHDRARVAQSVTGSLKTFESKEGRPDRDAARGAHDFLAYLADGLEHDLRGYVFRLETGHRPTPGARLPRL